LTGSAVFAARAQPCYRQTDRQTAIYVETYAGTSLVYSTTCCWGVQQQSNSSSSSLVMT